MSDLVAGNTEDRLSHYQACSYSSVPCSVQCSDTTYLMFVLDLVENLEDRFSRETDQTSLTLVFRFHS